MKKCDMQWDLNGNETDVIPVIERPNDVIPVIETE